jgi:hypothetical protein
MIRFCFLILIMLWVSLSKAQTVYGILLDTQNKPIRNAWISLFGDNEMVARAKTDEKGSFAWYDVRPNSYHIMIRFEDFYRMLYFVNVDPQKKLRLRIDPEKENESPLLHPELAGKPIEMSRFDLKSIPITDGFDFPVGDGEATRYYIARKFGEVDHQGEDWNGRGGGNSDLGDDVLTIANGLVIFAGDEGEGWGNVVRVLHNTGTTAKPRYIESVYAHLDKMLVAEGQKVYRGGRIGTIGTAHGRYIAHLHLEIRNQTGKGIGGGYGPPDGYLDPSVFIRANRPWWRRP